MRTRFLISIILIFLAIFIPIQLLSNAAGAGPDTREGRPWVLTMPGRHYTLTLYSTGQAEMKTDGLKETEDYTETGSWYTSDNGAINVMLDGRADGAIYDGPVLITLAPSEGKLLVVESNDPFLTKDKEFEQN